MLCIIDPNLQMIASKSLNVIEYAADIESVSGLYQLCKGSIICTSLGIVECYLFWPGPTSRPACHYWVQWPKETMNPGMPLLLQLLPSSSMCFSHSKLCIGHLFWRCCSPYCGLCHVILNCPIKRGIVYMKCSELPWEVLKKWCN